MIKIPTILFLLVISFRIFGQEHGFAFGKVGLEELQLASYDRDTAASAVYLNEFGEAFVNERFEIVFTYHAKIKILKKAGLSVADVEIPLYRNGDRVEVVYDLKASSFNLEDGMVRESKISLKDILIEHHSKRWSFQKVAIPNVRVGSIVEIAYSMEIPFLYNFKQWNFQTIHPKKYSEYWATIPANFMYNVSLTGNLKLSKNQQELLKDYFKTPQGKADCGRLKYAMKDIPAFYTEDYMTAPSNFMSAIRFELSEITRFDGTKDKVTETWADVAHELKTDNRFGVQLKKGKAVFGEYLDPIIAGETDQLKKAKRVHEFIKSTFVWDESEWMFSELGIKKAFDARKGNVGDINLSLIAALRYAGLDAHPVLLSTRENGSVHSLHPVISEFNYVVARLRIGNASYLLDAADDYYPFGLLPERCLNGKGRLFGPDSSAWVNLEASQSNKQVTMLFAELDEAGVIHGRMTTTYSGYAAVNIRKKIVTKDDEQTYFNELLKSAIGYNVERTSLKNLGVNDSAVVQDIHFNANIFESGQTSSLFNPILERWNQNPFKSRERLFPVDFGAALEQEFVMVLTHPSNVEVSSLPERLDFTLPNDGGRFTVDRQTEGNKLTYSVSLRVAKPVYSPVEYPHLKEMFNKVVLLHQNELLIQRKK